MGKPPPDRPLVFKFGGACFIGLDDYATVADYILARMHERRSAVVIVSAMSGTTGTLRDTQRALLPDPPPELSAPLLATADSVSSILLATALHRRGARVRALGANELGMTADGIADRARLADTDPAPLSAALSSCDIVVIPGGQAADHQGRTVMLGRNSSDLTAVAAAVALNAECCEIYSDVPGVCTADPHLFPDARVVPRLGYAAARAIADAGAKVLHPRSVELAELHDLPIICRSRPPEARHGTTISGDDRVPIVVTDSRARVWWCPDDASYHRVRHHLAGRNGVRYLTVNHEDGRHVVVPGEWALPGDGQADLSEIVRPGLYLVSVVGGPEEPERYLVEPSRLAELVAAVHTHCRPGTYRIPGPKRRSPLSGILSGSPPRVPKSPPDSADETG